MDDLIAFLRARLDDDTRSLGNAQNVSRTYTYAVGTQQGTTVLMAADRFRAEIDAKRRRLDVIEEAIKAGHDSYDLATVLLPLEALPYAGHPDYRDAWRP